jgi:hypothetical protein
MVASGHPCHEDTGLIEAQRPCCAACTTLQPDRPTIDAVFPLVAPGPGGQVVCLYQRRGVMKSKPALGNISGGWRVVGDLYTFGAPASPTMQSTTLLALLGWPSLRPKDAGVKPAYGGGMDNWHRGDQ